MSRRTPEPAPTCGARAAVRTRYDRQRYPDLPYGTRLICSRPEGHDGWHRCASEWISWTEQEGP